MEGGGVTLAVRNSRRSSPTKLNLSIGLTDCRPLSHTRAFIDRLQVQPRYLGNLQKLGERLTRPIYLRLSLSLSLPLPEYSALLLVDPSIGVLDRRIDSRLYYYRPLSSPSSSMPANFLCEASDPLIASPVKLLPFTAAR
jgi:hypothetical protein